MWVSSTGTFFVFFLFLFSSVKMKNEQKKKFKKIKRLEKRRPAHASCGGFFFHIEFRKLILLNINII